MEPWTPPPAGGAMNLQLPSPELYDLEGDPCESSDCADDNADVVAQIQSRINQMLPSFPVDVQSAWNSTMNKRVEYSPSGAYPVAIA